MIAGVIEPSALTEIAVELLNFEQAIGLGLNLQLKRSQLLEVIATRLQPDPVRMKVDRSIVVILNLMLNAKVGHRLRHNRIEREEGLKNLLINVVHFLFEIIEKFM